jgi:hypothetical protein
MVLTTLIAVLIASTAVAGEMGNLPSPGACREVQTCGDPGCCGQCGCHACCEKYCKVVCEMKEVKKTVWVVKCSDFCAPLPGCPKLCNDCCESCDQEKCEGANCDCCCKKCNPCDSLTNRNYFPPKCGKVREKKTLEKKEVVCKIPSYKCIVVYACGECGSKCGGEKVEQKEEPTTAPAPTPKTTQTFPLPPIIGTSFAK